MSARFGRSFWLRTGWIVVLLVLGGAGTAAYGQAGRDTTRGADTRQAAPAPPAPLDSVRAEDVASPDTSAPEKAIVTADSLSAMVRQGERVQELFDNVRVRQDTTRLRSNYGLRYLNQDELLFTGDVVIYERGDTLRADTVWYNKRTKVGRARSNVELTDGEVVVRAPKAIYYTERKRSVFPDSVTLVDSSRVLRARQGTYRSNERLAEFSGNVRLTDPETYLEADSLTYFRDQERSIATGSVFIRRVGEEGEEVASDTTSITYLFGEWADNQEQNRYSRVERQALLVRVRMDSTGAPTDTLAVRAHQLEAKRTDTYHSLVAVDSVRIWQADLAATADSAVYDRVVAVGRADTAARPAPLPDTSTTPVADTPSTFPTPLDSLVARAELVGVDVADTADVPGPETTVPPPKPEMSRRKVALGSPAPDTAPVPPSRRPGAAGRPTGAPADTGTVADTTRRASRRGAGWATPSAKTEDDLPLEETRLFRNPVTWFERAQVWGDSIRVRARNRSLDTVYVRGAAFAAQKDTTVDRIRQLKGRNITAYFHRDSLRKILARPNGEAIYFSASEKGKLNGATRASADFVELHFRKGSVERIKFGRGVQGKAYHKKEYIPDPFRLEGFQWTPERRPTRAALLRRKRVRERLDLGPRKKPPPRQSPPVARVPSDTTAQRPIPGPPSRESRGRPPARPGARGSDVSSPAPPDSLLPPDDSLRSPGGRPSSGQPRDTSESSRLKP